MSTSLTRTATIVLAKRDPKTFEEALGAIPVLENLKILSEGKVFEGQVSTALTQTDILNALSACDIKADICVQANEKRKKKLLICDMDSTLIGQECIDELADFAGVKERVSAITERAMRGEIEFEPALRERVALLAGLPAAIVDKVLEQRITLMPGGRELVQTMRAHGAHTSLVSGGFSVFAGPIGGRLF